MAIQRWSPGTVGRLRSWEEIEDLFDRYFYGWPFRVMWRRRPEGDMGWAPSMDIYEKDDAYFVRAELPGVNMEDIDISMSGNTLTIKGERKPPSDIKEEEYDCSELCYGNFSRSISMSEPVNASKIEATLDNGILEIRLPKMVEAKTGKIPVKAKSSK
jgi:HSP20 family protein